MSTTAVPSQQSNIWWVFLLQGFMAIILGLMFLTAPGATLVVLVTFLGFYWLITGVLALVRVFVDRSVPWIWSLLVGIVGILAGIFVLHHPLLAALTVPTARYHPRRAGANHGGTRHHRWLQGRRIRVVHTRGDQHSGRHATAWLADRSSAGRAARVRRAPGRARRRTHSMGIPRPGLTAIPPAHYRDNPRPIATFGGLWGALHSER